MPRRIIALLLDSLASEQINLVRTLYDRALVDAIPPHVRLLGPIEDETPLRERTEELALMVGAHPPFLLELAAPQRAFDGERPVVQMLPGQGAAAVEALLASIYRHGFPRLPRPPGAAGQPALVLGHFDSEAAADRAVAALAGKSYFLVVSQVGILEERGELGWAVERALDLGALRAGPA